MFELKDGIQGLKELESESIDLILTDPPYKITSRGNAGNSGGLFTTESSLKGDIFKDNNVDVNEFSKEFYRVLKSGTHCYVMTNNINLIEYLTAFVNAGFKFVRSLIWDKGTKIMGSYYMGQFEYILFFRKGEGRPINNCETSDILRVPFRKSKYHDGRNKHDTEKPVQLMKILIENSTHKGETVLDPFAGIASTLVAANETDREYIGFEINPEYHRVGIERLKNKQQTLEL